MAVQILEKQMIESSDYQAISLTKLGKERERDLGHGKSVRAAWSRIFLKSASGSSGAEYRAEREPDRRRDSDIE